MDFRFTRNIPFIKCALGWDRVYAPVICNTVPPPPPTGNSGDKDFSSITALLKALYSGDLLIALLFIRVNSTGYIYVISQAWHRYCGGTLKDIVPHISPAITRRCVCVGGGGQGLQMTDALESEQQSLWVDHENTWHQHGNLRW